MNSKYPTIEIFRKAFFIKHPNSKLELLEFINNKHIKVKNKYGVCICIKQSLLKYGNVTIRVAVNKTKYFINQAIEVHGDKYDYSKVNWMGAFSKILIYCKIHNEYFEQVAHYHLSGCGCSKCGEILKMKKITKSETLYIEQLDKKCNGKYTIKKDSYINDHTKILHYCNIQKYWFLAKPSHILAGHGCRKCANIVHSKRLKENPLGWSYSNWEKAGIKSKTFDSFKVYILEIWDENEHFFKIGKTYNTIKRRFEYKKALPYKWKILKTYVGEAKEISVLEQKLKNMNKENKYIPLIEFSGKQECYVKLNNYEEFFT
jgi:hypothetical protein